MAKGAKKKVLVLRQTKSAIRRVEAQAATLRGLGFRRIGHTVEVEDTPMTRGMLRAVSHMVEIVEERG
jgi:large subunit ribosomal protein L30